MCDVNVAFVLWEYGQKLGLNAMRKPVCGDVFSCCHRHCFVSLQVFVGMDEHGACMAIFMTRVCSGHIADSACRRDDFARIFQKLACRFGTADATNLAWLYDCDTMKTVYEATLPLEGCATLVDL